MILSVILAALWLVYVFCAQLCDGTMIHRLEMSYLWFGIIFAVMVGLGALASAATFDLEPVNGLTLAGLYFIVSVVLALLSGLTSGHQCLIPNVLPLLARPAPSHLLPHCLSMLPEVVALHRIGSLVRIPPAQDVPVSDRVRRILDLAPMRRLASISQLGMVSLVYPGATHSRLEHSLGVYHNALRVVARFSSDSEFTERITPAMAEAFVLAALVHDIGHWPYCHPIEDMDIRELGEHESRIRQCIYNSGLAECIDQDWKCDSSQVLALLEPKSESQETDQEACCFFTQLYQWSSGHRQA